MNTRIFKSLFIIGIALHLSCAYTIETAKRYPTTSYIITPAMILSAALKIKGGIPLGDCTTANLWLVGLGLSLRGDILSHREDVAKQENKEAQNRDTTIIARAAPHFNQQQLTDALHYLHNTQQALPQLLPATQPTLDQSLFDSSSWNQSIGLGSMAAAGLIASRISDWDAKSITTTLGLTGACVLGTEGIRYVLTKKAAFNWKSVQLRMGVTFLLPIVVNNAWRYRTGFAPETNQALGDIFNATSSIASQTLQLGAHTLGAISKGLDAALTKISQQP